MNAFGKAAVVTGVLSVLCACGSLPDRVDSLEQARVAVRTLERDPIASDVAANELAAARTAIMAADEAYRRREPLEIIEHKAYVAQRYADISRERISEAHAREQVAQVEAERRAVLREQRAREAEFAVRRARAPGSAAKGRSAEQRNREIEAELAGLKAMQTERGLVVTLGDVLFGSGQTALKPGAAGTLERIAKLMRDHPDRRLLIEGHTDARGADDYNLQLSERRAGAVRDALVERQVDPSRIATIGLGESYPIADNATAAGMQTNRRVEIVISDENGVFPGAVERTAAARPSS